jgi:hypothetical protein
LEIEFLSPKARAYCGRFTMPSIPCSFGVSFSVFVLCMLSVWPRGQAPLALPLSPSIQPLEIQQTPNGPVISNLFGRFALSAPLSGCPLNVGCPAGSHLPPGGGCCDEFAHSVTQICNINPACNGSICAGTPKDICCASGCIQDYPPACAGCQRTGYCTN